MDMFKKVIAKVTVLMLAISLTACAGKQSIPDPLPSWGDGVSKQKILAFVADITDQNSHNFVPVNERIATFDNDGTLWSENPFYFQVLFVLDRVRAMAADHPEWQTTQPFQAVLENDMASLFSAGADGLNTLSMATTTGMTAESFSAIVNDWIDSAKHPASGKPYTQMVYQPMLELLDYLRANQFKLFIVSGGGLDFMRAWSEAVYGIPPHQVVGSSIETRYEVMEGSPVIRRMPEMHFYNNKTAKPLAIHRFIGRRPILAVGNSDGDFEMLEWTTSGDGARLGMLVHHTDAKREWAYDRLSIVGRLDRGLDAAQNKGWVVVDMARDWKVVFP